MKRVLLIALLCGLVCTTEAQTSSTTASGASECKLALAQAPAIRGIRLGMSVDQVLAQIPGSEDDSDFLAGLSRDHFGSRGASVVPGRYVNSREKFAGINSIHLGFLDGRLLSFSISYDGPEWQNSERFVARLAEVLNLPGVAAWKSRGMALAIACDGFEISAQAVSPKGAAITMKDMKVDIGKVVYEREQVPKEKARRAFRP